MACSLHQLQCMSKAATTPEIVNNMSTKTGLFSRPPCCAGPVFTVLLWRHACARAPPADVSRVRAARARAHPRAPAGRARSRPHEHATRAFTARPHTPAGARAARARAAHPTIRCARAHAPLARSARACAPAFCF